MSSTDRPGDAKAKAMFTAELVPLAEALRARGKRFFPLRPDPALPSYFAAPRRPTMAAADFELPALESPARFIAELARLWRDHGDVELAALAPTLEAIAAAMADERPTESDAVAPFVYTMF